VTSNSTQCRDSYVDGITRLGDTRHSGRSILQQTLMQATIFRGIPDEAKEGFSFCRDCGRRTSQLR
jgi:hypothetical protein